MAPDTDSQIVKLYKWKLRLRSTLGKTCEEYPVERFVSAQLLSMIESQGVQRFVIHNNNSKEEGGPLLVSWSSNDFRGNNELAERKQIWIFNTNVFYSSTLVRASPRQAMKVYYKHILDPTRILEQESLKVDELQLQTDAMRSLASTLQASTRLLPVSAQKFHDWSMGFLER